MVDRDEARTATPMEMALLDGLLSQPHVAIAVCDANGVLVLMSPAMERLMGVAYSPTSQPVWASSYYIHDEHGQPLPSDGTPLARTFHGETVTDQVVSVRRPGAPARWGLANGFRLYNAQHEPIGAAVVALDVTDRAEEKRRLDDLRDRLIETVNHEVRTPVAKLKGHLELLEDHLPDMPEPVQWSLAAIRRATDRLSEVVVSISELAEQSQQGPSLN